VAAATFVIAAVDYYNMATASQPAGIPYPLGHGHVGITTRSGIEVTVRHMQPGDAQLFVDLFHKLGERTRWLRFFSSVGIPQERLWDEAVELAEVEPLLEVALIATITTNGGEEAVGIAELIREAPLANTAEVAIVLRDDFQREGIGRVIFDLLVQVALVQGLNRLYAITLPENLGMQKLARGVGLPTTSRTQDGETVITMYLGE
jgi:acetyltransferase